MINVENVTRKYGDFTAVDKTSFSISPGEIVGLLGHNGAGKTTIMKMLTGYLEPTEGKITINGREMSRDRQHLQGDIGYLPENCPVYPEMTVVDYLDYAASLHNIPPRERPPLVMEAIARTALADKAHQTIATLSRGYRQRTGVAQAILHKPGILILDEPTNGLDPTQIRQMRDLIRELAQKSTVLISTHILQEVQATCDRVIIIKNGRKALDTRLADLHRGGRLLVTVGGGAVEVEQALRQVPGVAAVDLLDTPPPQDQIRSLGLQPAEDVSRQELSAAVAREIHDRGWSLYSLHFETRDLETVFAQISAQ